MKEPFLIFDCSELTDAVVVECVSYGQSINRCEVRFSSAKSQQLLEAVQQLCVSIHMPIQQLQGIVLVQGSRRFTVARLGAVTANALAWSLRIPVCGFTKRPSLVEMERSLDTTPSAVPIEPFYTKEPTVTV